MPNAEWTLTEIIEDKTNYDHGESLKKVYETLNAEGNNKDWQLFILNTLTDAIKDARKKEYKTVQIISKAIREGK